MAIPDNEESRGEGREQAGRYLAALNEVVEPDKKLAVGRKAMTSEPSPVLEFPAWLHDTTAAILRKVRAEGRWWAREYLKTGAFPQPRQMRQVLPGEVLVMHSAAEGFDWNRPRWRVPGKGVRRFARDEVSERVL